MSRAVTGASVELLEMRIDCLTAEAAVQRVVSSRDGGSLLTPNLQHLREFQRSPAVAAAYRRCELVVADGMPLIWASRIQGTPLPARIPGSDLVWSLSRASAEHRRSLFLLGGSPGTAVEAGKVLARRYQGLRIAGTLCPPLGFEHSAREMAAVEGAVAAAEPDLVYIGLPLEKQLIVMDALREAVPKAWLVGLGVSFSFVTGDVQRAPDVLQRLGLEWAHRLSQEPRRLARRYLIEGLPFFVELMARSVARRGGRRA